MLMKILSVIVTLLIIIVPVRSHATEFSVVGVFFDRAAYEKGKKKQDFKPEKCPDGSDFLVLDFSPVGARKESEIATCFYPDVKNELIIEHVWEEGVKIGEYSKVNDILVGPEVSKIEGNAYIVNEYCQGTLIRTEVVGESHEVLAILLYFEDSRTASVVINFEESSKSKNVDLVNHFKPCDYSQYGIQNKAFNKWLNRDWLSLSLQPTH
jgi:hypothetical protein